MENIYENASNLIQEDLLEQNRKHQNSNKFGVNGEISCNVCK